MFGHSYIWDIMIALLAWRIFNWNFIIVLLSLFILAQFIHFIFCGNTTLVSKSTKPVFDNTKIKII